MTKNMKFHVVAVSIISVVIIVLYMLIGPKPQDNSPKKPTDRYARMGNATWGLDCNAQIDEAIHARESVPLAKDASGKVVSPEPLKKVTVDNVLPLVKKICEGQVSCAIQATDDALGISMIPGCYKQLSVNYRCSDADRLITENIDQGQWLKIDCTANAPATAPHNS